MQLGVVRTINKGGGKAFPKILYQQSTKFLIFLGGGITTKTKKCGGNYDRLQQSKVFTYYSLYSQKSFCVSLFGIIISITGTQSHRNTKRTYSDIQLKFEKYFDV